MIRPIEEKLRRKRLNKIIVFFSLLILPISSFSYEIIRDPITESYLSHIIANDSDDNIKVKIINDPNSNAFVIGKNIFVHSGLFEELDNEDSLKSILFHELGHLQSNHYESKYESVLRAQNKASLNYIVALGIAVFSGNPSLGIASTVSLNQNLINQLSKNSIKMEIEADSFMLKKIKKYKLNTSDLISFLNSKKINEKQFNSSHPSSNDRIIQLEEFSKNNYSNSKEFEWIKSKYSKKSKNITYNEFFINLEKGLSNVNDIDNDLKLIAKYETYKIGIYHNNPIELYEELIKLNDNSYLLLEYLNLLIDNDLIEKFNFIEESKTNKFLRSELYFYYIYGKYYNKINDYNLANFYFCQFYQLIKINDKVDYYCKNYNEENISQIDLSYALFK